MAITQIEADVTNLHIVVDAYGNPWGPFKSAADAAEWAKRKWPEPVRGKDDFDVCALREPDDE